MIKKKVNITITGRSDGTGMRARVKGVDMSVFVPKSLPPTGEEEARAEGIIEMNKRRGELRRKGLIK